MDKSKRVATTAERLQEAMQAAGKKPVDLVKASGIDRGAISRYLAGKYEPKQTAINKLAVALNVSEMWLWGYDVPMQRSAEAKKNDALVGIVQQLRRDPDFLDVVQVLAELPADQYDSIKQLLATLRKK
jgi:transcriptional regulator with XRE-family HTH domain